MVPVQENDELQEHVIYYLSWNLVDDELIYNHVDKLSLVTFHAIHRLRHYILIPYTIVVAHINPFQIVLTIWMIGGK